MATTSTVHALEPKAPRAKTPKAKTASARMMVNAFDDCIHRIKNSRDTALEFQDRPRLINHHLLSALVLAQLLMDWEGGTFNADFPNETEVIAAIRGSLGL